MSVTYFPRLIVGASQVASGTVPLSLTAAGQVAFAAYKADPTGTPAVNAIIDPSALTTKKVDFYVAQYTGNILTGTAKSYPMQISRIRKIYKKAYNASVQQVSFYGYDGSSATGLSYICDTDYTLGIRFESQEIARYYGMTELTRNYPIRTACCADCDSGCASADCWAETWKFVRAAASDTFVTPYAKIEMLTNGTFTASSGGAAVVTNLVNVIVVAESAGSAADAGLYNSDGSTIAIGDYIRIGGTGATSPVYKVANVTNAGTASCTIELDAPYQGASASVSAANIGVMTSITSCGIRVTGKTYSHDSGCACEPFFLRARPVTFKLFPVTGWDCTIPGSAGTYGGLVTYTTAAVQGNGTGAEVAELENELLGYTFNRERFKNDARLERGAIVDRFVSTSTNYDLFYIVFDHTFDTNTILGQSFEQMYTIIAVDTTASSALSSIEGDLVQIGKHAGIFGSAVSALPSAANA